MQNALTRARRQITHRLIRPLMDVYLASRVKRLLQRCTTGEATILKHLHANRPMEPLIHSLGMRMERPAMIHLRFQTLQPYFQCRQAVVAEHRSGQAVTLKKPCELSSHCHPLLISTCHQAKGIAGVIIHHRQLMARAAAKELHGSFEIHLPQFIVPTTFKPLQGSMVGWRWPDQIVVMLYAGESTSSDAALRRPLLAG